MKIRSVCIALIAVTMLAGCQSTGTAPTEINYSIFFSPSDHIQELLSDGNPDAASEVYEANLDHFSKLSDALKVNKNDLNLFRDSSEKLRSILNKLAGTLTKEISPQIKSARKDLSNVGWPAGLQEWPKVKASIKNGDGVIRFYEKHKIFQRTEYTINSIKEVRSFLHELKESIRSTIKSSFVEYPHFSDSKFFDSYPLEINAKQFLIDNKEPFIELFRSASVEDIARFSKTYSDDLPNEYMDHLGRKYFEALIDPADKQKPITSKDVLMAMSKTLKANLPLGKVPGFNIGVIKVKKNVIRGGKKLEFPVDINKNIPVELNQSNLSKPSRSPQITNSNILLFVDVDTAKKSRPTQHDEIKHSEYRSGTKRVSNPAYVEAEAALNLIQDEIRDVEAEIKEHENKPYRNTGRKGDKWGQAGYGLSSLGLSLKKTGLEGKLDKARENLRNIPMFFDEDVYVPYKFSIKSIKATKDVGIKIYLVDKNSKKYFQEYLSDQKTENFKIPNGLHDDDRQYDSSQFSNNDDLTNFENKPYQIQLTEIIDKVVSSDDGVSSDNVLADVQSDIFKANRPKANVASTTKFYSPTSQKFKPTSKSAGGSTANNRVPGVRIALVMGNGSYPSVGDLINPPNDARLMAHTLRGLGFEVVEVINAGQKEMKRAISSFAKLLEDKGQGGVGLFYYAGHGVQVDGRNYLIPVDAKIQVQADVDIEAVTANTVLRSMEYANTSLNFVILDACRNNPYTRSFRSASRGLARMDAPRGTLIAYATRPGDIANDGVGSNSPYTEALARTITKRGMTVSDVFIEVRNEVMRTTGERQVPWEEGGLTSRFYFAGE